MIFTSEFDSVLRNFLIKEGFTHVYSVGIRGDNNYYKLIPLKPSDPRLAYDEIQVFIEKLNHNEIIEMTEGYPPITFVAEMETNVYSKFLNMRNWILE